jgi:hypothetical protein
MSLFRLIVDLTGPLWVGFVDGVTLGLDGVVLGVGLGVGVGTGVGVAVVVLGVLGDGEPLSGAASAFRPDRGPWRYASAPPMVTAATATAATTAISWPFLGRIGPPPLS